MAENTRVPANTDAVDRARETKESNGETWTDVMEFYAEHRNADAHTELSATVRPTIDEDALGEVTDNIDDALAEAGVSLTYDDVKAACSAAIREELPVGEMGR